MADLIEAYFDRIRWQGCTKRDAVKRRTQRSLPRKAGESMSSPLDVSINGIHAQVLITNKPDSQQKKLIVLDGDLKAGSIVAWGESHWLVVDTDQNDEVYPSGDIERCNYVLKFKNAAGEVVQKHCIIADVTKYLIGEAWKSMMTIGDSRMSLTIPRDADTAILKRGMRFLIDDPIAEETCAYEITKPDRVTNVYDGYGVYKYLCREVNSADTDNKAELIPDNTKYEPATPGEETGGWF
jgi:hypothetical protein|nr:MAG TPA: head closure knob [Caudoviricetes sp.]